MQKVILESQDLSIDKKITFDKRNKLINKINNFLEENEMTRDIELIKTHSHNVHIIDVHNKLCEQIIFDSPSNLNNIISKYYYIPNDLYDFRSPYNLYNFRYHCAPKFIYDPNYKKNISLPVLLGLSPVKQDIFSACSYIKKFTYACDLIVQLASDCSIYQGNIIYFSPNMIEQQITRTLDGYRNLYLLNDYLFIVLEEKGLIINHSLREKEALVRIYDCIFNWLESKPICIIKKLPNTYEVKELTYINVHPSHKKQIIDFITFLTNKNYYILYCFIRIFKSIYNMEVYKRKGYIFLNCSEKIFSLYKKFLSIFNIKCGMGNCLELESTSELNKYDYIPEIIKASFGYAPIFINSIINSNTNNINKLLSGVALENYHIGRLNENGFLYGKFHCKNNVPILIYSDGKESSHKFINALKDYLYKLDFKNMEISDEEFENCSKFINSLDSNLIEYIVSCFSSYDGSPEDEQFDNETSAITDKECVIKFVKDCCKSSKNSIVFTADIYEIYKKYAYNELGISESNIDSSTFSKYFKEASKAESKRTNKGRGYINISINYDAEPLSKDKLIEMKATKEARENTAFDKLLNAVFI